MYFAVNLLKDMSLCNIYRRSTHRKIKAIETASIIKDKSLKQFLEQTGLLAFFFKKTQMQHLETVGGHSLMYNIKTIAEIIPTGIWMEFP